MGIKNLSPEKKILFVGALFLGTLVSSPTSAADMMPELNTLTAAKDNTNIFVCQRPSMKNRLFESDSV